MLGTDWLRYCQLLKNEYTPLNTVLSYKPAVTDVDVFKVAVYIFSYVLLKLI
jgi:hypothetical protein